MPVLRLRSRRRSAIASPHRRLAYVVSRISAEYRGGTRPASSATWPRSQRRPLPGDFQSRRRGNRHGFRRIRSSSTAVMRTARSSRYAFAAPDADTPDASSSDRHDRIRAGLLSKSPSRRPPSSGVMCLPQQVPVQLDCPRPQTRPAARSTRPRTRPSGTSASTPGRATRSWRAATRRATASAPRRPSARTSPARCGTARPARDTEPGSDPTAAAGRRRSAAGRLRRSRHPADRRPAGPRHAHRLDPRRLDERLQIALRDPHGTALPPHPDEDDPALAISRRTNRGEVPSRSAASSTVSSLSLMQCASSPGSASSSRAIRRRSRALAAAVCREQRVRARPPAGADVGPGRRRPTSCPRA